MVKKTKLRPRRLFKDKDGRYFYLINNKKKFVNTGQIASQKQISKINIQNIIPVPVPRKRIRKPSEVKPITNQQIVTKLVPIAPVSANLSDSRLFKGKETDDKKKLEDDNKKLEDDKKKLEDEKRKTGNEKRKVEIETLLSKLETRIKKVEDAENKYLKDRTGGVSLEDRMAELMRSSTGTLSDTSSVSSERIPKVSKSGLSPELRDIAGRKDKSPAEKIREFIKTSIAEKEAELDLTPAYVNTEEVDEGDVGFEEETKKKALKDIKKKLKDIVISEYAKNTNYSDFVRWWEKSPYGTYKIPTENQFNNALVKDLYTILGYSSQAEMDNADKEEVRKRREEKYVEAPYVMSRTATNGRGSYNNDSDGIFNDELTKIFQDKTNKFLPVIASDKMETLLPLVNRNTKKFGWIQNTDPSSSMGRHWVAYFIDVPNLEINFFDSLVENGGQPTKQSLKGLRKIIDKINPEYYLKLKTNSVILQSLKSNNCGYFALKFILDRYRNIPFRTATMYDKITGYKSDDDVIEGDGEGEKMIKKFKRYL